MLHMLPTWEVFPEKKKVGMNVSVISQNLPISNREHFLPELRPKKVSAPSNSSICLVSLKTSGSWIKKPLESATEALLTKVGRFGEGNNQKLHWNGGCHLLSH